MKTSPIFPRDERGSCNELGYDPKDDFCKVLLIFSLSLKK